MNETIEIYTSDFYRAVFLAAFKLNMADPTLFNQFLEVEKEDEAEEKLSFLVKKLIEHIKNLSGRVSDNLIQNNHLDDFMKSRLTGYGKKMWDDLFFDSKTNQDMDSNIMVSLFSQWMEDIVLTIEVENGKKSTEVH